MSLLLDQATLALTRQLSATMRAQCEHSFELFCRYYLNEYFQLPPSEMHKTMFGLLQGATIARNSRIALAAPRGHAKSTLVSQGYVLWSLLYAKESFVLLVSSTKEMAVRLLAPVKDLLEEHPLLLRDFPHACRRRGGWRRRGGRGLPWKNEYLVLPNGCAVLARGRGQGVRGARHNQYRPTLIVVDDVEDREQVRSAEQRAKVRDWFDTTLLKLGDPKTNAVLVGTILHHDSLLANLMDQRHYPGWTGMKYAAVESFSARPDLWETYEDKMTDVTNPNAGAEAEAFLKANEAEMMKGTKVLWPHRETYPQLMIERRREGVPSFQSEKQNQPLDPEECLFADQTLRYWDDHYASAADLLVSLGPNAKVCGACHPSLGRSGDSVDYTAIVTVALDMRNGFMYVLDADLARRRPEQIIERIVALMQVYPYQFFGIEDNQFQELFAADLLKRVRKEGLSVQVTPMTNTTDKKYRIESLQPGVASGTLRFSRTQRLLLDQLRQFPLGAHDDGPDALEMAVRMARFARKPTWRVIHTGQG